MESAKLTFKSAQGSRRILAMALVLSLALPLTSTISSLPVAFAKPNPSITGTGTFADTSVTILSVSFVGSNEVITDAGTGVVAGTMTGTYAFAATITIQPTGMASYKAIDVCKCTISPAQPGILVFSETGTGNELTGSFQSTAVITLASGGLRGMTGAATLVGIQNPLTSLTSGTYSLAFFQPKSG